MTAAAIQANLITAKPPISPLELGGALSAVGALCVVVTTVFYVMSPPAVAGPVQPLDVAAAMSGAVLGAKTLHAAGLVGLFGDLIWAAAAVLIAGEMGRRGRGAASFGWLCLLVSIAAFTLVDGITGFVLPPLGASASGSAFEGFKRFWDMLFLFGVGAYAIGSVTLLGSDASSDQPMVGRVLASLAMIVGVIAGLDVLAAFAGVAFVPTDKIAGACIGLGSALFIPISLQIARGARPAA